jgi:FkbM family methyltransferase
MTKTSRPFLKPTGWQWPLGDTHFPADWSSYQKKNRDRFWYWTQQNIVENDEPPYMPPSYANCLIDIGAHAGSWSLDLKDRFTTIIAYEPEHWATLTRNAVWLGAKNIDCRPRALSDRPQTLDFYTRLDNSGDSGIDLDDDIPRIKKSLKTTTLDLDLEQLEFTGTVNAIKIDVQGHEYQVIKGAEHTIRTHKPTLCLELNEGNALAGVLLESWDYELRERVGKDWIWLPK